MHTGLKHEDTSLAYVPDAVYPVVHLLGLALWVGDTVHCLGREIDGHTGKPLTLGNKPFGLC